MAAPLSRSWSSEKRGVRSTKGFTLYTLRSILLKDKEAGIDGKKWGCLAQFHVFLLPLQSRTHVAFGTLHLNRCTFAFRSVGYSLANMVLLLGMKIGKIDFGERPVFLAPMEDVTDIGFRLLCKRFGAAMVYTEFVSAEALVRSVKSTVSKLTIGDEERPVGIQIYGRDVPQMVEAARIVEEARPDVIDLNFGCPVKKVAGKGAGAGMLRNIPLMLDITREVVKAVSTPVTVKTRLGWDKENLIITNLAERLQDCGIQALTIHGRTRSQMYTGDADWTIIGEVKRNPRIHIPIIGNGDIHSLTEADLAFERYGVDAVMIGRATFGQPWLFSRQQLTIDEKIDILKEQLMINIRRISEMKALPQGEGREEAKKRYSSEYRGILHTRRHLAASPVFKGIPDFRQMRIAMLRAETVGELTEILELCRERLHMLDKSLLPHS